jgi:putative transposase
VLMARENTGCGYDRIVGALANLDHRLSDQTVGNILRRHGIAPAPKRSQTTSWKDFIAAHKDVLVGADFFTVELLSWRGLVSYYVLLKHPDQEWMEQIGRGATQESWGYLDGCRYVLHDRDTKFCGSFRSALAEGGVKTILLSARSPNLNAFSERWVRSSRKSVYRS